MTADDSSDSDVICLTPRSSSPLSQGSTQQSPSRPATPAKNKWSHIFGTKSPQKKLSSPGRKLSPRKRSPRKCSPSKHVAMVSSSLTTSCEHYTLGIPLFHHIMQWDDSALWNLPKVEPSTINGCLTHLPHNQSRSHLRTGVSHDAYKDHLSKGLVNLHGNVQKKSLALKVILYAICLLYGMLTFSILHVLGNKENLAVFNLVDFCNSPNRQNKFYTKFKSYTVFYCL